MSATRGASAARRRVAVRALGVARFGHAQWFFGNLYEAIVRVPDLLAARAGAAGAARSPVGRGSPVRYYDAAAPATLPALVAAVGMGWRDRASRPWLVTAAACSAAGMATTAYLVPAVNRKVFFGDPALTDQERDRLLRRWYWLNAVRLGAVGGAWLAGRQAQSRLSR